MFDSIEKRHKGMIKALLGPAPNPYTSKDKNRAIPSKAIEKYNNFVDPKKR